MESLFGRFPHLVEDIYGQLDGETLFRCSHIDKIWNRNLEEYRLHLVKNIQRLLKNQSVDYGHVEKSPIAMCPTWGFLQPMKGKLQLNNYPCLLRLYGK